MLTYNNIYYKLPLWLNTNTLNVKCIIDKSIYKNNSLYKNLEESGKYV